MSNHHGQLHCCYSRTKHATPQTYGWMKKSETKIENPSTKASSKQSRTQSRRSKKLFRPLSTKRKTGESLAILLRDKLQGTVLIMWNWSALNLLYQEPMRGKSLMSSSSMGFRFITLTNSAHLVAAQLAWTPTYKHSSNCQIHSLIVAKKPHMWLVMVFYCNKSFANGDMTKKCLLRLPSSGINVQIRGEKQWHVRVAIVVES